MAGNTPFSLEKFSELILYIGQHPLRSGRVGLAVILWKSDFEAYWKLGRSITGATYLMGSVPGRPVAPPGRPDVPRGILAAVREGWRWGAIEHRLLDGQLTRTDAQWIARRWRAGVPV